MNQISHCDRSTLALSAQCQNGTIGTAVPELLQAAARYEIERPFSAEPLVQFLSAFSSNRPGAVCPSHAILAKHFGACLAELTHREITLRASLCGASAVHAASSYGVADLLWDYFSPHIMRTICEYPYRDHFQVFDLYQKEYRAVRSAGQRFKTELSGLAETLDSLCSIDERLIRILNLPFTVAAEHGAVPGSGEIHNCMSPEQFESASAQFVRLRELPEIGADGTAQKQLVSLVRACNDPAHALAVLHSRQMLAIKKHATIEVCQALLEKALSCSDFLAPKLPEYGNLMQFPEPARTVLCGTLGQWFAARPQSNAAKAAQVALICIERLEQHLRLKLPERPGVETLQGIQSLVTEAQRIALRPEFNGRLPVSMKTLCNLGNLAAIHQGAIGLMQALSVEQQGDLSHGVGFYFRGPKIAWALFREASILLSKRSVDSEFASLLINQAWALFEGTSSPGVGVAFPEEARSTYNPEGIAAGLTRLRMISELSRPGNDPLPKESVAELRLMLRESLDESCEILPHSAVSTSSFAAKLAPHLGQLGERQDLILLADGAKSKTWPERTRIAAVRRLAQLLCAASYDSETVQQVEAQLQAVLRDYPQAISERIRPTDNEQNTELLTLISEIDRTLEIIAKPRRLGWGRVFKWPFRS